MQTQYNLSIELIYIFMTINLQCKLMKMVIVTEILTIQ